MNIDRIFPSTSLPEVDKISDVLMNYSGSINYYPLNNPK